MRLHRLLLLAAAPLLALPTRAHAQLHVSPPTVQLSAQAGPYKTSSSFGDINSSYQLLGTPDDLRYADASLINLNSPGSPIVPFVTADAEASGLSTGARAESSIIYQIQYTGPQDIGIPITVHVSGLATNVSRSGGAANTVANATAYMFINNDDSYFSNTYSAYINYSAHATDQFGSSLDTGSNFLADTHLITRANTGLLTLTMDVIANVSTSSNVDASVKSNVQLDPFISIDPSFPDADLYTFTISPGVANTPAPEPATLSLLSLAALPLLHRRRR